MARHTLNGFVVTDSDQLYYDYFGVPAFSPAVVRSALAEDTDDEIIFEVNSPGGLAKAGQEMYTLLRNHGVGTVAEVQSLAASSASILICGCEKVMVSPAAQIMIHPPFTDAKGDESLMSEAAQMLHTITESALNVYERKCGAKSSRNELAQLMNASTWLDAHRALDLGLADGILYDDPDTPEANIYNSIRGGISGIIGTMSMPAAAELRRRYDAEHTKEPEPGKGNVLSADWRNAARLELVRHRR